jgi:hypothetical protein
VKSETRQLRSVLEALEAKRKEREWLRHKDAGDLDDRKLVEGLAGDRNIYQVRGEPPADPSAFQELPKKAHFLFDLSKSMMSFGDGRLERTLEAAVMLMEALAGYDHRMAYRLAGHSGDTSNEIFVEEGKPPRTDLDRLRVIKQMYAHCAQTASGDNTLAAAEHAVQAITERDADEYFVFLISDANVEQYGITAGELSKLLKLDARVKVFVIFIGTMGEQAARLMRDLPTKQIFVALETSRLPKILKTCLTSAI